MLSRRLAALIVLFSPGLLASCAADPTDANQTDPKSISRNAAALLTAATPELVSGTTEANETVAVSAGVENVNGENWVVAYNAISNPTDRRIGWSTSTDLGGTTWTDHVMASGTEFGTPGDAPALGGTFVGWRGDPSLARVTNPIFNDDGQRVLLTAVASSTSAPTSDVIIAISTDRGDTFQDAQFVNSSTTGNVDAPKIASNTRFPWGTYVSWAQGSRAAYINEVVYDASLNFTRGTPEQVPDPNGDGIRIPSLAVGSITACGTSREAVYVVWATDGNVCGSTTDDDQDLAVHFRLAVWDPSNSAWYGPFDLDADPNYAACIGATPYAQRASFSTFHLDISADPESDDFGVVYTKSDENSRGMRTRMKLIRMECVNGDTVPSTGDTWTVPGPVDDGAENGPVASASTGEGGPRSTDPAVQVNDQWSPSIAYSRNGGAARILVTWYDTREDPDNTSTRLYHTYSEDGGGTWAQIAPISQNAFDLRDGNTWDYNNIGVHPTRFLSTWGGDPSNGTEGAWSSVVQ